MDALAQSCELPLLSATCCSNHQSPFPFQISPANVMLVDDAGLQDGMDNIWNAERIASHIDAAIAQLPQQPTSVRIQGSVQEGRGNSSHGRLLRPAADCSS